MPKTMTKRKRKRKRNIKSSIRSGIQTKRMAGFEPQKVARQLASMDLELARRHNALQLRIDMLNIIEELRAKFKQYQDYRETLQANDLYNYRSISTISIDLIEQVNQVLDRIIYLIRLHDEAWFLEQEVIIHGYNSIRALIPTTLSNMDTLEVNMQLYEQNLRDEYRKAELGIVNKTARRADAIIRNPESMRTTALTRRTRSR